MTQEEPEKDWLGGKIRIHVFHVGFIELWLFCEFVQCVVYFFSCGMERRC